MQGLDPKECLPTLLRQRLPLLLHCLHSGLIWSESAAVTVGDLGTVKSAFKGLWLLERCKRCPLVCPCVWDLVPILHPEAVLVLGMGSSKITMKSNRFDCCIQWQDDLIRGIDLWFWKTERKSNLIPELRLEDVLILPPMLWCGSCRLCAVFKWSV